MIPLLIFPCLGLLLPPADLPKLFVQPGFNSRNLAEAANYFIAMGEDRAFAKLASLEVSPSNWTWNWSLAYGRTSFSLDSRVMWMCRMLYEPKGSVPLRNPKIGCILPFTTFTTTSLEPWPLFPLVLSGESYFLLGGIQDISGTPESAVGYLQYCRSNGSFRAKPVALLSRKQSLKDIALLTQSEKWKAIKWKKSGPVFYYSIPEESVLGYVKSQAEGIPEKPKNP